MAQELTHDSLKLLVRVNRQVNADIRYKTDAALYGKPDYWTVIEGKGQGDCDDYALTKIKRLVDAGWDRENLSVAVCYVETGEGHAVCIARTTNGDFVLDNRYRTIMPYEALPYRWVMLEDYKNRRWVRILPESASHE